MEQLSLRFEFQENPVVDEVSAMIAVVRLFCRAYCTG
jgi:hypothetical protein